LARPTDKEVTLVLLHPVLLLDDWQIALYVVVILVALFSVIALLLMAWLIVEVLSLVRQLRNEIRPLMEQAQETVRTVQGTTEFVSSGLVKPAIQTASIAAGVMRTIAVLRSGVIHPRERTAARDTMVKSEEYVVHPDGSTAAQEEYAVRSGGSTRERSK
jgi:hypothetical protein